MFWFFLFLFLLDFTSFVFCLLLFFVSASTLVLKTPSAKHKTQKMGKSYTWEEVRKHNNTKDCWLVVGGEVYDVTKFLKEHPGGEETLIDVTGVDAKSDFDDVNHSDEAKNLMKEYHIGTVEGKAPPKTSGSGAAGTNDLLVKLAVPVIIVGVALAIRYWSN